MQGAALKIQIGNEITNNNNTNCWRSYLSG